MTQEQQIAAEILYNASAYKTPCDPIRTVIGETDIATAYGVQEINIKKRQAAGEKVVGKKNWPDLVCSSKATGCGST